MYIEVGLTVYEDLEGIGIYDRKLAVYMECVYIIFHRTILLQWTFFCVGVQYNSHVTQVANISFTLSICDMSSDSKYDVWM